jgi:uncharacterized membrane protein YfhO
MSFWRTAFIIFGLVAAANYFPLLLGLIPFPSHLLPPFPAWGGSLVWPPIPEIGDLITSFYPFHAFAARSIRNGEFPLWNPHILGGAPFLANSQSALFYPPNWLYYVLPVSMAWTACLVLRTFLCGLFMALFVRSIGATRTGAILAGIVYSSCGFMTAWQGQALGDATIWLPLICFSLKRLRDQLSRKNIALAAFSFAMPVLAGHPETAAHSTLVGCAWALTLWERNRRYPFYFAAAGILAMGLASVQMIPTLEWLGETGSQQFATPWPALVIHQAQGLFSRDILSSPNSGGISIPEGAAYLGMMTLLVASFAPLHRSRRYVAFLMAMTGSAMMIAYSIDPLRWLVAHTPYLKAMKNGRFIFVVSFGVAALAGLGLSTLQEHETALIGKKRRSAWLLLAGAFAVVLVAISRLQLATQVEVPLTRRPTFSAFLLCAALVLVAYVLWTRKNKFVCSLIVAFAFIELTTFSHGFIGFTKSDQIYPGAAVFDFLEENSDPAQFRVTQLGISYSMNVAMIYGFAAADGYEVSLERPRLFASGLTQNREDGLFFVADKVAQNEDRRLDLFNVKYLVVPNGGPEFQQLSARADRFSTQLNDGHVSVFENKRVLPRAFLVPAEYAEVIPDQAAALQRLQHPSFDPHRTVIVSQPLPDVELEYKTPPSAVDAVEVVEGGTSSYRFRVQSRGEGILVVSQIFYPGWTATVNGERVPVLAADYALTGIPVPAGDHEVRFVFDPLSFKLGLALTILSVLVAAALTVWAGLRL